MKAYKWNYISRNYDEAEIPDGSAIYCENMDEVIKCAACGKKMIFGYGYTSIKIHTEMGMGYCVCGKCYQKEWNEVRQYELRKSN